jgi:F-type H+-transporting ATPase subunit a
MEHHYSFLYKPVNDLLIKIFGVPGEGYLKAMGAKHGDVFWLPDHVIMCVLVVILVAATLIPLRKKLSVDKPGKLQQMMELLVSGLEGLIDDVVGHGHGKRFLPFIGALAVFIFVGNIFGLFFFVQPPTQVTSTTFALSITAFLFYNIIGLRDNGIWKYTKHFFGPVMFLAPLMFIIEVISHAARILSLAIRLFGNISGEHRATGIFFWIFPFMVPWPMMGLGIFGALLQAFIFIMLTMAYLNGAVAHEEH